MTQKNECSHWDRILTLELEKNQMSKDIQEIKDTAHDTQKAIKDMSDTMKSFMLTAPQKYADKKEMEEFKNWINSKIAYITGAWAVIVTIVAFVVNKYFG